MSGPTIKLNYATSCSPICWVVLGEAGAYVTPTKIIGPPALVVEILSPSTSLRDRSLKLDLYAVWPS